MNESRLQINKILENIKKTKLSILGLIIISAFIIRIYFGNFELPVISDSYGYFLFASDISINFSITHITIQLVILDGQFFLEVYFQYFNLIQF